MKLQCFIAVRTLSTIILKTWKLPHTILLSHSTKNKRSYNGSSNISQVLFDPFCWKLHTYDESHFLSVIAVCIRAQGLGFRVRGLGFRVQRSGLRKMFCALDTYGSLAGSGGGAAGRGF